MTDEDVTRTELAILDRLWEEPGRTIRELSETLYGSDSPSAYATVQKLLDRLQAKGFVTRERSGRAHRFSAAVERGHLIDRRLRDVADQLCAGSVSPLLTHLVESQSLDSDQLSELRALLDKLDRRRRRRPRPPQKEDGR